MGENIKTYQSELAHFIEETKLLGRISNGEFKPLKISTIKNYISTVMNEDKKEKKHKKHVEKNKKKQY
ncbi:hypothetical protein [Bacteroides sp.]